MIRKIDSVLERVKDPESELSVAELGLVTRVRYSERYKRLAVFTDFISHQSHCMACAGIGAIFQMAIDKRLTAELQKEFPDLTIQLSGR